MSHDMTDISRHLAQIADTPRDRPPLDITRSFTRGRRILRIRRLCAVTGTVGLVVALAVVGLGLTRHGPQVSRPSSEAQPYRNPVVQRAAVGWLPAGYVTRSFIEDNQNGGHSFETDSVLPGPDGTWLGVVSLTDYGVGPEPILGYLPGARPRTRIPAPPVRGNGAYWLSRPGVTDQAMLRWQYGPGRWAELDVSGTANDARTVYRIAESITFGLARPMPFPLRIKGLPPGLMTYRSLVSTRGGSQTSASISLALGPSSPDSGLMISMNVPDPTSHPRTVGAPSREITIDGHRAAERRSTLTVRDVNGLDVTLQASDPMLKRLETIGGLIGLYRHITVLGTDPTHWTTAPLS